MKITKIYKESSEITDTTKDKVIIELSSSEYVTFESIINLSNFEDFQTKFNKASRERKIKWVK